MYRQYFCRILQKSRLRGAAREPPAPTSTGAAPWPAADAACSRTGRDRLVPDGEVHRVGDEARVVRLSVQRLDPLDHGRVGDGHLRAQHDLGEPAAVARLL